jgi:3-dehydroquinate synthase
VAPLYGERVATSLARVAPATVVPFPAGEWNKTRETWADLTDRLLTAGVGRDGAVLALGGGVVGDVAGFVAATYLRGIPYVQIPTTLLAMIDSSIGGKTGVDTPRGKNLVGAFHQPRVVVADVATLQTLPPVHRAAGAAEAIKHGVIADAAYLAGLLASARAILGADPEALLPAVRRSIEIKAAVVAEDEREAGRRAILNFGHTVGHALEAVSGYALLHGEAVAVGMAVEAELGVRAGVTEPGTRDLVLRALETFRLPCQSITEATTAQLLDAMAHDKKARRGAVRFALPRRPGEMARDVEGEWTIALASELIGQALAIAGFATA